MTIFGYSLNPPPPHIMPRTFTTESTSKFLTTENILTTSFGKYTYYVFFTPFKVQFRILKIQKELI